MSKPITIALVGNPNTGKTSLLNALTGLSLHVGNWPGKTVEKKEAALTHKGQQITLVDLPGIYTLHAFSEEEKVSKRFLDSSEVDVVIQVIDVNALSRHLLMTYELLASGKRVVLAVNFNHEAKQSGLRYNLEKIEQTLGIPMVAIEAHRGKGKIALLDRAIQFLDEPLPQPEYLAAIAPKAKQGIRHREAIEFFQEQIAPHYKTNTVTWRFYALDKFFLNKFTALPAFFLVMTAVFMGIFSVSSPMMDLITGMFDAAYGHVGSWGLPPLIDSFIGNVLLGGLGTVLAFVPLLFLLFFMIAFLEDSGYLGRTMILVDRFFAFFGITGRSFIPIVLGLGCNVPAVLATRTIKNERERIIAIIANSFITCGARLPVLVLMAGIFFPAYAGWLLVGLYAVSILVNLLASVVMAKVLGTNQPLTLIIELPPYRLPTLKNLTKHAWFHVKEFLEKAATTILLCIVGIWVLAVLPFGVEYGSPESLLGMLGSVLAPLVAPLGFGQTNYVIALLFGVVAKEVVVGSLATIAGVSVENLGAVLTAQISPAAALSFMVFVMFYIPCVATIAVMKSELGRYARFTFLIPVMTLVVAWGLAFLTYQIALQLM